MLTPPWEFFLKFFLRRIKGVIVQRTIYLFPSFFFFPPVRESIRKIHSLSAPLNRGGLFPPRSPPSGSNAVVRKNGSCFTYPLYERNFNLLFLTGSRNTVHFFFFFTWDNGFRTGNPFFFSTKGCQLNTIQTATRRIPRPMPHIEP